MRAVIQRVKEASVTIDGTETASIEQGLVVLLGIAQDDTEDDAVLLARKVSELRLFPGAGGEFDTALKDHPGFKALIVSQFTLYGDCRKGRRPSFAQAAAPDRALALYQLALLKIQEEGIVTASGTFQAMMDVRLLNWGPVTVLVDTKRSF